MRRGLTLIELIFAMVIVALVFTVVPKIVFATNKSFETTAKEDALYNAMALMGILVRLPWDEANTRSDAILATSNGDAAYRCDETTGFYRVGGFKGGRNCLEGGDASDPLGREDAFFNDLDDYDGYTMQTTTPYGAKYRLDVSMHYLQDPSPGGTVDLRSLAPAGGSSDIKEVNVTVTNAASRKKNPFSATLYYHSGNIGAVYVRKRPWR